MMKNFWTALLLFPSLGCANFQTTTAADRLCAGTYYERWCYETVEVANARDFDTAYEAAQFGLAQNLKEYPDIETAGLVMKNEANGRFYITFAGAGTDDRVNLSVEPDAVAWYHTHVKGTRKCSVRDEHATLVVNQRLGRKVYSYVQHKHGNVVECKPRRAPQNTPVPRFGRTPVD